MRHDANHFITQDFEVVARATRQGEAPQQPTDPISPILTNRPTRHQNGSPFGYRDWGNSTMSHFQPARTRDRRATRRAGVILTSFDDSPTFRRRALYPAGS